MIQDPILREVFELWPAWQTVVEHILLDADPKTVPPAEVEAALGDLNGRALKRLAHRMVADAHAETLGEAVTMLGELWGMAMVGRRPRFGAEVGLSSEEFEKGGDR